VIWSVLQRLGGQTATMLVFFALAALLPPAISGSSVAVNLVVLARLNPEFTGLVVRELEKLRPLPRSRRPWRPPPPVS
jgi:hypothetical protein